MQSCANASTTSHPRLSAFDSLVAGKTASAQAQADDVAMAGENLDISLPASLGNGDGQSSELIHRIRALRQRSARTTAAS
jgi:hypothetical protein